MSGHRRLTLVVGINQTLTWGMTFYLPAVIAGPAGTTLGMSRAAVLGAFSCALLISGFCAPRVGKHIDRHGGRGILVASCAISAAGMLLLAAAQGIATWYAGWLVLGVVVIGLLSIGVARDSGPRTSEERVEDIAKRVKRVSIKTFMDAWTLNVERLQQCCVHVGTRTSGSDQCAPFCAVQAWPSLARQRMSHAAGRIDE